MRFDDAWKERHMDHRTTFDSIVNFADAFRSLRELFDLACNDKGD